MEGCPGSWRRGQNGACGAPSGAARGGTGCEGLGAGSRWSRIIRRKTERRAPGAGGGKETPEVAAASPLSLRGLREMAEPPAGPAAGPGPVIDGALTPFHAAEEADGARSPRPPSYLRRPGAPSAPWASLRPTSTKEFILLQPTSRERLRVRGLGRPLSTCV